MARDNWLWRMLGASGTKNQRKSRNTVLAATEQEKLLRTCTDAEIVDKASSSVSHRGIDDAPLFLASVREASRRSIDLFPYISQLHATVGLLSGDVVEMATGEGKTLTGAMAAIGFALQGKKVHVITVNSYLAQRDATWMGPLLSFFNLSSGYISEDMTLEERRTVYSRDIIFAAVNDLGFDVLRDQLIVRSEDAVRTPADVAIIDEADSVMVDEALVPLVLAGNMASTAPEAFITDLVRNMKENTHYQFSADKRNIFLTDRGAHYAESQLEIPSLYEGEGEKYLVHINVALHAQYLLERDVHYIVRDGAVALIDGSRGRVADLQRWPDGLQAAVEAKEGLRVTDGGRILDTLTIQALLGMYPIKCGMTGTAVPAKDQLNQFYNLSISVIDPNVPTQRFDERDRVYATAEERDHAVIVDVLDSIAQGQPVLIGTQDIAASEKLASMLDEHGVEAVVLNAKNHEHEAGIISQAGMPGKVTVSTQMAGRGTDIKLGGSDESERESVIAAGGLRVIGVGRFRSQRLDNQLRGRAGRQGDPGYSVFYVSLEDDVITVGNDNEELVAQPDDTGLLTEKKVLQFVDHCQRVTEGQMLDIHATTWKYNKLITDQREIINQRRAQLLSTPLAWEELSSMEPDKAQELQDAGISMAVLEQGAREIMLYHLDYQWSEHLAYLDDMRESIHLRAIARESPIDEFHRLSIAAFKELANTAVEEAKESFREAEFTESGVLLEDLGLHKPSATWTYMVNDNPLSSGGGSVVGSIVNLFR